MVDGDLSTAAAMSVIDEPLAFNASAYSFRSSFEANFLISGPEGSPAEKKSPADGSAKDASDIASSSISASA